MTISLLYQDPVKVGEVGLAGLFLAAGMVAAMVTAQTQSGADGPATPELNETVVTAPRYVPEGSQTATKTGAPLIETPQSVSVITRDQIDLLNFIDVQQAVRYSAGVVGENYGPDLRYDFLTVRGFIPVEYIDGLQAPVSAAISNIGVDLYGFQTVDILKGPSAVLYGSTPPGGIYNLTSRRPDPEFGGEIQAKYGDDDFKQVAGTVTGSLAPGVSARFTGLYRDRDSQTDFVSADRLYLAPAVTIDLLPRTKLTLLGFYQHDRVDGDTNGFLPVLGVLQPNPVGFLPRSVNLGEPGYNFYNRDEGSVGYELVHRLTDAITLTQNFRYSRYDENQQIIYPTSLGADDRTVGRSNFPDKDAVRQIAVDTRAEAHFSTGEVRHDLLVGVDYRNYREEAAFGFGAASSIDLFNPVYGQAPIVTPAFGAPYSNQRLEQTGLYFQDQAHLGGFVLTATGRQDWTTTTNYALTGEPAQDQDHFSYRVGGTYVFPIGVAPYVSYATSFQPQVGADRTGRPFDPTEGDQVEGGVKYDARSLGPDVRLLATAAAYQLHQTNVLTPDPVNNNFNVETGEARVRGVELEVVTRLRDALSINASYTYADAEVTKSNTPGQVGAGLFAQPRHKASLFVDYTVTNGRAAGLGFGAGVRYVGNSPGSLPGPFNPIVYYTGQATLADAVVRYSLDKWRIAVNVSNLFDKRYAGRCIGPEGCFFAQGRQTIATLTRSF